MEERKHYFRLGLFVVVTFTILAAVLFLLGGRKLFQPTFTFETYFNESVAGLEVGAPVRFRGVPLGQVTEIVTAAAIYEADSSNETRSDYIVVRGKVTFGAEAAHMQQEAVEMVKKGLRAQTQLAGITGQQYLAVDFFDPATHPPLPFKWTPKYTYVPSAPSLTSAIIANVQTFLANLNEADIKRLGQNLNALVVDLDKKVSEVPTAELSAKARDVLNNANATIERIDRTLAAAPIDQTLRRINSASARLDALLADPGLRQSVDNVAVISARVRKLAENGDLDRMVKRIDDSAERLDALIGDNQYGVRVIVQDLRVTADNLRVLSETVKRYPAGALIGGPPDKVQIPREFQMSVERLGLAAFAALILAACSIGKPIPQATTYVVDPPMAAAASPAARRPETLLMGNVRVAAAYAGNALVYRVNDVQYTSDPYHTFIAEPGAMLGNRMAEWLDRAGPFNTVAQPGSARPARYVLEATVTELYGDFREGRAPAAVMTAQFALIDQGGARPRLVREMRTFTSRVDLPQATPDALVRGYSKALAEVLSQLVPELGPENGQ